MYGYILYKYYNGVLLSIQKDSLDSSLTRHTLLGIRQGLPLGTTKHGVFYTSGKNCYHGNIIQTIV